MRAAVRTSVLGVLLAALAASSGCNAVLGIEEATLEPDKPAPMCVPGQGATLKTCAMPSTLCEQAIGEACTDNERSACLANSECRKALTNYRTCAHDDCVDPTGDCTACLSSSAGAGCYAAAAPACQGSELVPLCEIFCACMGAKCSGKLADCMQTCSGLAPWEVNCRLTHCELALPNSQDHCLHATGELPVCPKTPPATDPSCTTKRLAGYGCDDSSQCCSNSCISKFCQP